MKKIFLILFFVLCSLFSAVPVFAADETNIRLRVEGPANTILNASLTLPAECQVLDTTTSTPHTFAGNRAICALEQAKMEGLVASYQVTDWGFGFSLDSINEVANAPDWSQTWIIRLNNQAAMVGIDGLELQTNDELLLTYGPWPMEPLRVGELSTTTVKIGDPFNLVAQVWDDNISQFASFSSPTVFWIDSQSHLSASGTLDWIPDSAGARSIWLEAEGKTRSAPIFVNVVSSTPEQSPAVNLKIRYQNQFVFDDIITLASTTIFSATSTADQSVMTTSTGQNVLAALLIADATSTAFKVSEVLYYPSFNSFYLNCLELASPTSTTACANWNYVVNGVYPNIGMDSYALQGNESVYIYFGNSWQITASTSTFPVQTTTTLATWRYNYEDLDEEWAPDGDDLVDISVPNPNPTGWWDATITTTTLTTNASGTVDYVFSATGTYYAKITSTDFSKWSLPITLNVLDAPVASLPEDGGGDDGSNGGTGSLPSVSSAIIQEKTKAILNFLKSQQSEDGKIIDGGITDWAIMSFGVDNQYAEDIKKSSVSLLDFAKAYNFTDASELNLCAGYPRHVLALLASGVSSADILIQSLIDKIKSSECYNNHQFGQNGINDDVFALPALLSADILPSEPIIADLVAAVVTDQTADGAFTWAGYPSPDITGAAINALSYARIKGMAIDEAIFTKAKNYLKAQQLSDGGWGFGAADVLTTSWAMMGINSLGQGQIEWSTSQNKNPWSVLVEQLKSDGYYESAWAPGTIDWFGTKHAVPALLGKFWPVIQSPKPQPLVQPIGGVGGISSLDLLNNQASTSTASSTLPLVQTTSTLPVAPATSALETELPTPNSGVSSPSFNNFSASQPEAAPNIVSVIARNPVLPPFPKSDKIEEAPLAPVIEDISPAPAPSLQAPVVQPASPLLPLEKKVATTTATGSAILFAGTTLFLFFRLLLTIV